MILMLQTKNKNLMNIFVEMQEDMKKSAIRMKELNIELKKESDNIANMSIVADCILARSKVICEHLNKIHSHDDSDPPLNFFEFAIDLVELTTK